MNFDFRYSSQRMPVMARNVVSTSQPLAAQAGLGMMQRGGNAVDAALASAIALTVVEPTGNGIGSDAFAIVWDGSELHGLNASGRSPAGLRTERFNDLAQMPLYGWDSVTVPGAVSSWVELSNRFGRLPFAELFEPAIRYAQDGFLVSPITAKAWAAAAGELRKVPGFADAFLPGGKAPAPGQRFRFEDQARTLERIADSTGHAFYQGVLAQAMVDHAIACGAEMSMEDLATHEPEWVDTISCSYRGLNVHEIPPNGQGLAALSMLGIVEQLSLADSPVDSTRSLHLQIESMKLAFADAHRYIADPAAMELRPEDLLDKAYLAERSALVDPMRARPASFGLPRRGGTVYVSAADEEGRMVSFIQSNFHGFGSGVVVPGTGISLQNRGSGFSLEDGHPNRVAGGKRPFHTIIPGFAMEDELPRMSFGVMGGSMQPQGHAQMIIRLRDYGQNPQTASDAPRWRFLEGNKIAVEPGFDPSVLDELEGLGHEIVQGELDPKFAFGGAQLIWRTDDGYISGSDHRKDGQAVGY